MSCSGCEARREWIRQNTERAKLKLQRLLQQLGSKSDNGLSGTDSNSQRTERSDGSNHEPK